MKELFAALLFALLISSAESHVLLKKGSISRVSRPSFTKLCSADSTAQESVETGENSDLLTIPLSFNEMVRQVASAVRDASERSNRQVVRVLLPRDVSGGKLGVLSEGSLDVDSSSIVLVPTDESWQGGIMQLYRSAGPTCSEILRLLTRDQGSVPPRILEDRSIDESGVDGMGVFIAQVDGQESFRCIVQPSQETIDYVESCNEEEGLVLLMNPQWRPTDDAFDAFSRSEGVLGSIASFLGGKGNTMNKLDKMGYELSYCLDGYICRGYNVRLMKRFDTEWGVFCQDQNNFRKVGMCATRPTYQEVEKMLVDSGYGYKYAEDIGI